MQLAFVETAVFTKRCVALGLEEPLCRLQEILLEAPGIGDLDPGTGGLRKARMPDPGRGKGTRGGARVHYLWLPHVAMIYLIFVYAKDDQSRLSSSQRRVLAQVVRRIKAEYSGRLS